MATFVSTSNNKNKNTSLNFAKSRYVRGGTTTTSGNFLGWWSRTTFAKSPDDVTMTISTKYHQNPGLLANDVYGNANLFWFILQYNNIMDATTEFVSGATILLPLPQRVSMNIL